MTQQQHQQQEQRHTHALGPRVKEKIETQNAHRRNKRKDGQRKLQLQWVSWDSPLTLWLVIEMNCCACECRAGATPGIGSLIRPKNDARLNQIPSATAKILYNKSDFLFNWPLVRTFARQTSAVSTAHIMSNGMGHFDGFSVRFLICWFCFSCSVSMCPIVCVGNMMLTAVGFLFLICLVVTLSCCPSHLRTRPPSPVLFRSLPFSDRTCYTIFGCFFPLPYNSLPCRICVAHIFCIIFIDCNAICLHLLSCSSPMPYHKQYNMKSNRSDPYEHFQFARDTETICTRTQNMYLIPVCVCVCI